MKNHFLKKIFIVLIISSFLSLYHCSSPSNPPSEISRDPELSNKLVHINFDEEAQYSKANFRMIAGEDIHIDTLYAQVAFVISPNRWIIIGNGINEDPTGLKLLLVDPSLDYSLIYRSKGAYESMILFPTFYQSSNPKDPIIILCALGQTDSWGQELFLMKGDTINEIAYLDVSVKVDADDDYDEYFLKDISSYTMIEKSQNGLIFSFSADSIKYFGFHNEIADPVITGKDLKYLYYEGRLEEIWKK